MLRRLCQNECGSEEEKWRNCRKLSRAQHPHKQDQCKKSIESKVRARKRMRMIVSGRDRMVCSAWKTRANLQWHEFKQTHTKTHGILDEYEKTDKTSEPAWWLVCRWKGQPTHVQPSHIGCEWAQQNIQTAIALNETAPTKRMRNGQNEVEKKGTHNTTV